MREGGREKEWERCGKVIKKRDGKAGLQAIKKEVGERNFISIAKDRGGGGLVIPKSTTTKSRTTTLLLLLLLRPPVVVRRGRPLLLLSLLLSVSPPRRLGEGYKIVRPPLRPLRHFPLLLRRGRREGESDLGEDSAQQQCLMAVGAERRRERGGGGGGGEEVRCFVQSGHKWGKVSSARRRTERKRDVGASGALVK